MITVIISQHGDPTPFWFTTAAIDAQMPVDYEYRIVSHGSEKSDYLAPYIKQLRNVTWQHFKEPLGAQTARQRASIGAKGDILYFSEDHVFVEHGYFKRALWNFDNGVDALHSSLKMAQTEPRHYHYDLTKLHENFYGSETLIPASLEPYRIALGNHGSWFIRREVFEEIGGYGPEGLLTGYGGDESYFDFKMALLDKTNWLDPRMTHWHHTHALGGAPRGYPHNHSDDYYRNLMTCALVIGGEPWLNRIYSNFLNQPKSSGRTMHQLYEDAWLRGEEHSKYLASIRHRTLDEQLELFKSQDVV
jgi:hypothetical protein